MWTGSTKASLPYQKQSQTGRQGWSQVKYQGQLHFLRLPDRATWAAVVKQDKQTTQDTTANSLHNGVRGVKEAPLNPAFKSKLYLQMG